MLSRDEQPPAIGRGKAILLGEHAVVHGHPAIAIGIHEGASARAVAAQNDCLVVQPWNETVLPDRSDNPLADGFAALLAQYPDRPCAARVEATVQLPAGAGLGCSAALGTAIAAALDRLWPSAAQRTVPRAGRVEHWERVFHGQPSGIDTAMAEAGGIACFQKGQPLERLCLRAPLHVVIGYSGERASTRTMVELVTRQRSRNRAKVDSVLEAVASLVQRARRDIERHDLRSLGQLLDLNQQLLGSLMLSTERLEDFCRVARASGALGAKLTGGGGGGCAIALAEGPEEAARVCEAVASVCESAWTVQVHR